MNISGMYSETDRPPAGYQVVPVDAIDSLALHVVGDAAVPVLWLVMLAPCLFTQHYRVEHCSHDNASRLCRQARLDSS